jgi:hypothetical protein
MLQAYDAVAPVVVPPDIVRAAFAPAAGAAPHSPMTQLSAEPLHVPLDWQVRIAFPPLVT